MIIKNTISYCPTCYKQVPAVVERIHDSIMLRKVCSEHGETLAMVERSADYYAQCQQAHTNNIYNGYFLDVTQRCNLQCKYCYHAISNGKDPSIENILAEARINSWRGPIILHGGEPSIREDLPELVERMNQTTPGVELLTNGTGLTDDRLDAVLPCLQNWNGVARINLSIHKEAKGKDLQLIDRISNRNLKLESVLFVIDNVDQIDGILAFGSKYKHCIEAIRIKAATKLWAEQKPENKIFVSDMLEHVKPYGAETMWWRNNMTSFFNFLLDGVAYMAVSWYDVGNVDLMDINCPPYYRARNGQIENIVTSCIINEGMEKGWLNGSRIGET